MRGYSNKVDTEGTQTMRIDFECSGGFANLQLTCHVDTDDLPEERARELLELVETSGVLHLQEKDVASTSPGPPDVFHYRLSLSEGGKRKSLSFNDVTAPSTLQPLLTFLRERGLDQRREGK